MTSTIKRRLLFATAFVTWAGGVAVAIAQPTAGPGPGMMGGGGPGMMMGGGGPSMMGGFWNTQTYLDALKANLAITPNEEPAWKEYTGTVSGISEKMEGLHQTMFEAMGTASWQERRDQMNQMFKARDQAFSTVHEAATRLKSQLTPAQQVKAQSILPGFAHGPGMMGQR